MKKPRVILVLLIIFGMASCAGIPKGALPDLKEPQVLDPPKLSSISRVVKDGKRFYQLSEADMKAEAVYRERLAGEVEKGILGMRAYRGLLEKCLER